jgi:HAE1 family hydrophobic/amphiphilic exporter-1
MVGMIVLAGVVVNNGIVLLDRIVSLRKEGMAREEAILRGVRDRIRPVLMTALTTITGLLPIAFSTPTGDGFSFQGLAIGVAGGLTCTTFFTLWVVPLAYTVLDDLGVRLRRIFGVRRRVRAPQAAPGSA